MAMYIYRGISPCSSLAVPSSLKKLGQFGFLLVFAGLNVIL